MNKNNEQSIRSKNLIKRNNKIKEFDEPLEQPGKILYAEIHGSAQRLLKIKKISKYIRFCKCCLLPSETTGLVTPYSCFDHKKDFGFGIYLYFEYIKFCILMIFISLCMSSIPTMVFSIRYTNHLSEHCRLYFIDPNKTNITNYTNIDKNEERNPYFITQNSECAKYLSNEYSNNTRINLESIISSDWLLKMSVDNIKNYYNIYNEKNNDETKDILNVLLSYSFVYFLTGITLLIINFFYVHYLNVLKEGEDYEDIYPSDFTILVHGVKRPKDNKNIERKEYLTQLIKEISQNYFPLEVHQIIPCYNLVELYKLSKELYEDKTKIYHSQNFKRQKDLQKKYESSIKKLYENKNVFQLNELEPNKTSSSVNINTLTIQSSKLDILSNKSNTKNNEILSNYYSRFLYFYIKKTPLKEIQERINKNKEKIRQIEKDINENPNKYNCGTYFVVFKYIKMRDKIYEFFPTNLLAKIFIRIKYFFQNILFGSCVNEKIKRTNFLKTSFSVEHATEAYEILWQNMGYSQKERFFHLLISIIITLFLVCITLAIVLLFNHFQYELTESGSKSVWKYILSFLISIFIAITNALGRYIFQKVTEKFETIETKTGYYISLSVKITFFTFINTTIVPVISNYIRDDWGNNEILINNLLMIFITNVTLTPFFFYIGPGLCLKYFERAKARMDLEGVKLEDSPYTQGELNEMFENPRMDLCYKYSFLVNILLSSLFYMSIFPLGTVFGLVALILSYFLETYYLGYYKRPEILNSRLCKFFLQNFKIVISFFFIGNYLFLSSINKTHKFWHTFNFIFFIITAFIPYHSFRFNLLDMTEGEAKKGSYEDFELLFPTDYEKQNPLTKKKAMIKYLKKLEQMNFIDKAQSDYLKSKVNKESIMDNYYITSKNIENILSSFEFQRQFMKTKKKYKYIKKIRQKKIILSSKNLNIFKDENDKEGKSNRNTMKTSNTAKTVPPSDKKDILNISEVESNNIEDNKDYDDIDIVKRIKDQERGGGRKRKTSQYMRKTLFQQIKNEGMFDESEEENEDESLESDNDNTSNFILNRQKENFELSLASKKIPLKDNFNLNVIQNNKENDLIDKKSENSLYSIKTSYKEDNNNNNNNKDLTNYQNQRIRHSKNKSSVYENKTGINYFK